MWKCFEQQVSQCDLHFFHRKAQKAQDSRHRHTGCMHKCYFNGMLILGKMLYWRMRVLLKAGTSQQVSRSLPASWRTLRAKDHEEQQIHLRQKSAKLARTLTGLDQQDEYNFNAFLPTLKALPREGTKLAKRSMEYSVLASTFVAYSDVSNFILWISDASRI